MAAPPIFFVLSTWKSGREFVPLRRGRLPSCNSIACQRAHARGANPGRKPLLGMRRRPSLSYRRAGRGERSSRVIADDHPRVTASPASVRLLEAPAPADPPVTGSAADLRRPRDEPVGVRSSRLAANDHPRATATPNSVCSRRQQRLTSRCLAAPPTFDVVTTCRSGRAVVPLQRERLPSCQRALARGASSGRKPLRGKSRRPSSSSRRSSRFAADDYPRATASPVSVRLLEAPAPADDMPATGSAAVLRRPRDEPVGARSSRVAANDQTPSNSNA